MSHVCFIFVISGQWYFIPLFKCFNLHDIFFFKPGIVPQTHVFTSLCLVLSNFLITEMYSGELEESTISKPHELKSSTCIVNMVANGQMGGQMENQADRYTINSG